MYAKERIQYVPYVKNLPSVPYNGNVSQMKRQYSYVNIYIYLYSALSNFYKELKLFDAVSVFISSEVQVVLEMKSCMTAMLSLIILVYC